MTNIAIDGTAGSGKSEIAKGLGKLFNFKILETGAIYRSLACEYRKHYGLDVNNENIEELLSNLEMNIKFQEDRQIVLINGIDYSSNLRDEDIAVLSSKVSVYPNLREKVLIMLTHFASNNNAIIEGRDIGTVVLPNADVKIFLTASQEERARRRFNQVKKKIPNADYDTILKDLKERDERDENREIAPLKPAIDAIIFDNTGMTVEESVKKCASIISHKIMQNIE